jgi:hypothetical protein
VDEQYGARFARFYAPALFIFGIFSVLLSAMQVAMAVQKTPSKAWDRFGYISRGFTIFTIFAAVLISVAILALLFAMNFREIVCALTAQHKKRQDRN